MKYIAILFLFLLVACGEKRNPDRCCVDEADCAAIGLPNGSTCQPGELCRGNECVEQTCSMSSQCDLAAPYCESGHCAEMCTNDTSCPVTSPEKPFCVSGGCVQCRETSDCGDLVCRNGSCGGCATDGECASGVCQVAQGVCAAATDIAFVTANGSPTSNCTLGAPCSLLRALAIDPPRASLKLAAGVYQNASTITVEGKRAFSGDGQDTTRITNTGGGPVFILAANSDVSFERLEVFGATNGATAGVGVRCTGTAKLQMALVRLKQNASDGLDLACAATITQVESSQNGGLGARLLGATGALYSIERTRIANNTGGGVRAEGGGRIRNTIIAGNTGQAVELVSGFDTRPQIEFCTIVGTPAVKCSFPDMGVAMPVTNVLVQGSIDNPLVGATARLCGFATCLTLFSTAPGCTMATDVTLTSDQHLSPNISSAIDAASGGAGTLDFDGELRPKGAGADIGADEAL